MFETLDALKILYALINTVGGPKKTVTIPAKMIENMPKDWMERLKFREIPDMGMYQAYLKPRHKRGKVIKPKQKKLILPPSCGLRN